jgi:hypothetical protein
MSEVPSETSPVVVTNEEKPTLESPTKKTSLSAPKWELAARERMKAAIKKFSKLLTDMLCEGFGFDKYSELTTEYRVKGEFADYGQRRTFLGC